MAVNSCRALTRAGRPCRVPARPGGCYCPFHDAACTAAVNEGRRQGGSRPYHRPSPPPDAEAAAQLLFRLLQATVDGPAPVDPAQLQAVARLTPLLFQALDRAALRPSLSPDALAALLAAGRVTGE
jgi:hypothetical protein